MRATCNATISATAIAVLSTTSPVRSNSSEDLSSVRSRSSVHSNSRVATTSSRTGMLSRGMKDVLRRRNAVAAEVDVLSTKTRDTTRQYAAASYEGSRFPP